MCGWLNLCRPVVSPLIASPPVILKVAASGCLPHLPFGAICPLGMNEYGCTLKFQLHSH